MSQGTWYYAQGDAQVGPVEASAILEAIQQGKLTPESLAWQEGMANWTAIREIPQLASGLPSAGPPAVPPQPAAPAPPTAQPVAAAPPPPGGTASHAGPPLAAAPVAANSGMIQPSNPPKEPILVALLSGCLICGLGQILLGQTNKGLAILGGGMLISLLSGGIAAPIIWVVAGIDAYLIGNKLKNGQAVGEWEWF